MSRATQSTSRRTLAVAGAILAASLAAPAMSHAQAVTSERMLLNHIAIPPMAPARYNSSRTAPSEAGLVRREEGARALLGLTPIQYPELQRSPGSGAGAQVDGERALLGQWPQAERHRFSQDVKDVDARAQGQEEGAAR